MIGRTFAHYRVLEKLGGGGMGEVYLAEDTRLHRRVAVKVLPAGMASDPERLERFAREAKAVGGLNHPNIVTIHSIEQAEGLQLLVMELVEGRTLAEKIPPGGLSEERFFELAIPLADAVSAAHDRGVTHRDLKPSNVMITEEGRVKVVDFGLAKLRQEVEARERTVGVDEDLTEEGRILGTYPYMSPEQLKGRPADHRSDIFSLGVVLYEMATGTRPFGGETSADLISAILRDTPEPVDAHNPDFPRHLHRILTHCLEKDPDRRFQTAKDLRNELQSLYDELHSERLLRTASKRRRRAAPARPTSRRLGLIGTVIVVVLLIAGTWWWLTAGDRPTHDRVPTGEAAPVGTETVLEKPRPSLAVLFFQNLTGDPELEWLRTGLTEMLVTDLAQSPGLRVVGTDRLYQIMRELEALDEPIVSTDQVREIAERTKVGAVLLGSYVQAGDTLQVHVTLKDPETGETLDAQRAQGTGEASIFTIVDRLSGDILDVFERAGRLEAAHRPDLERAIEAVTTSSVEAYRLYAEGMRLSHAVKLNEAIPLFKSAIELDPGFAMAHARLARIYETLGREEEMERALEEVIQHADRLTPRERFYVEGTYYGLSRETYGRAVAELEEALQLYPDHLLARYQLGLLYSYLELFQRAAAEFEEALRRGYDYDGVFNSLASMYTALGQSDRSRRFLERWVDDHPSRWSAHMILGWNAVDWGAPGDATEALDRAEELRPGSPFLRFISWRANIQAGRWSDADRAAKELAASSEPYWRWRGLTGRGILALYRGRPEEALLHWDAADDSYGESEPLLGVSRNLAARTLLRLERPDEALAEARGARAVASGDWPAWEGLLWGALAEQRLGNGSEASRLAAALGELGELLPGTVEERFHRRLLGLLAFERQEPESALADLERAEELLPPRGLPWHRHRLPDHAGLWYELATVQRHLGRSGEAATWYRRVIESGVEHTYFPIEYVRSHYFLARLLEERGQLEEAQNFYRTFLGFWGDGTIDRDRVADARRRLAHLE